MLAGHMDTAAPRATRCLRRQVEEANYTARACDMKAALAAYLGVVKASGNRHAPERQPGRLRHRRRGVPDARSKAIGQSGAWPTRASSANHHS